jgi:enoyl-CoA hydratase
MNYETLQVERRDRIAFVAINRPDKLNALNAQARSELKDLFLALQNDDAVDVVILTGAGEKAFVAGTDIKELTELDEQKGMLFSEDGQAVFNLIENLGKPVIAAVNGYALGGGAELALACHMNLGIIPGYGGTQRLARLVGKGRAMELILTGESIDAPEALRIGLVNKVVAVPELMKAAESMARKIIDKGQVAVRLALMAITATHELSLESGQA